jgi:peptide-methionine (R)-S-oxide reductase
MKKYIYLIGCMLVFSSCSNAQDNTAVTTSEKSNVVIKPIDLIKDSLKNVLSQEDYEVTCNAATEPAFSNKYWNHKADGSYHCKICQTKLFDSDHKYASGSGWPSFYQSADSSAINFKEDMTLGAKRVEITCGNCDAHLGHIFEDGPMPTGQRFCVNSASLNFSGDEKKK